VGTRPADSRHRIVTVTANAALDRTLWLRGVLAPGTRHIVEQEICQAGGKGVNVSRALLSLGATVRTIVVVGGPTGDAVAADLEASGLEPRIVRAAGSSRTCTEILDGSRITQLHGEGVRCDANSERELLTAIEEEIEGAGWLALCGSLPGGLSDDLYARAIERARRKGVPTALDASGIPLRKGLAARPDLVRVTIGEASDALALPADRLPAFLTASSAWWVLSDGPNRILGGTAAGEAWSATPPRIHVRNPIGCGDAMHAGLLAMAAGGSSRREALRFAIALAASDAEQTCAGRPDVDRADELARNVEVRERSEPGATSENGNGAGP
jgi:tagatose 6-phosphate kinase